MFRGKVTAVTDAGVYVLCADVASTPIGPCQAVVAPYTVGDQVLVVNVGTDAQPDLVVVGKVATPSTSTSTVPGNLLVQRSSATQVTLRSTAAETYFTVNPYTGSFYQDWLKDGSSRWTFRMINGGNFQVINYDDSGTAIGTAFQIQRSTGKVTIGAAGPTAGIELGAGGPTITAGTGAPSHSAPNGSTYHRTDGTASTTLYVRAAGAWTALS